MGEQISKLLQQIRQRKKQILFAVMSFIFFVFFLFPFEDLADYITEQIAKNTQNQVFMTFSELGISLLPPGLSFDDVSVDTPVVPTLKASSLSLAPSIASFLAMKPGFVVKADGLFDGDASLSYKTGKEINDELNMQNITIDISDASLNELANFASLPIPMQGSATADINSEVDPSFGTQPTSDYIVTIQNLKIPASTVPTALGPLALPNVSFQNVNLKGRLVNGELFIEESQIGEASDSIHGRIKGKFALNISRIGTRVVPRFGAYELKLDLNFNRQAESELKLFLGFYDKYRTVTGTGSRYAFQLNGSNFQAPPQDSPLRQF